jgi:hypothetical protein
MTDKELQTLFRQQGRELDARQRAQLQRLREAERELFAAVLARLQDTLTIREGRIISRASEAGISRAIDQAFREASRGDLRTVHVQAVRDLLDTMRNAGAYYKQVYREEGRMGFGEAQKRTIDRLSKRLGIEDGKLKKGGYLDRYFSTRTVDEEVKSVVNASIAGKRMFRELQRQLEVTIKGTRHLDGAVTRAYAELITDTYHKIDRTAGDQFGVALKFRWFTFEGGLIETSRKFCIKRDGHVFNTIEAERWRNDPELPKTTKERESGVVTDYIPTRDMGRWNCRHRVRWISEQMAKRLAPERFN